jgi:hypothetical protein
VSARRPALYLPLLHAYESSTARSWQVWRRAAGRVESARHDHALATLQENVASPHLLSFSLLLYTRQCLSGDCCQFLLPLDRNYRRYLAAAMVIARRFHTVRLSNFIVLSLLLLYCWSVRCELFTSKVVLSGNRR